MSAQKCGAQRFCSGELRQARRFGFAAISTTLVDETECQNASRRD